MRPSPNPSIERTIGHQSDSVEKFYLVCRLFNVGFDQVLHTMCKLEKKM
jgi:hypothetical protein